MPRRKKMTNQQIKQLAIDSIIVDKLDLLHRLEVINTEYNALAPKDVINAEEAARWFSDMPIKSLADLDKSHRVVKLDILRERSRLKKIAVDTCNQLDRLDTQLRIAKIDLLEEQIKDAIKRIDEISGYRKRSSMASKG